MMTKKYTATVNCCFCSNRHTVEISLPDGWDHQYDGYDDEGSAFCPDHAAIQPFTRSQCVGCVGGWGECDLWKGFAFSKFNLSEGEFDSLRKGVCPRRTNRTFSISPGGPLEDIDLSDRAPSEAGVAFVDAIKTYVQNYDVEPVN